MAHKALPNLFIALLTLTLQTQSQYNFIDWPYVKNEDLNQITSEFIKTKTAQQLNTSHLQLTNSTPTKTVTGIVWPQGNHMFISLPVKLFRSKQCPKTFNIIFKVNTGVSQSTLSAKTLSKLNSQCGITHERFYDDLVQINGREESVFPLKSYEDQGDVNLLGIQFFWKNNVKMTVKGSKFTLQFMEEYDEADEHKIQSLYFVGKDGQL